MILTNSNIPFLENLERLDLSYNTKFRDFRKLTKLKSLNLKRRTFDDSYIENLQLTKLICCEGTKKYENDRTKSISITSCFENESLKKLTNLTKLSIFRNSNITSETLSGLTNLKSLSLYYHFNGGFENLNLKRLELCDVECTCYQFRNLTYKS